MLNFLIHIYTLCTTCFVSICIFVYMNVVRVLLWEKSKKKEEKVFIISIYEGRVKVIFPKIYVARYIAAAKII